MHYNYLWTHYPLNKQAKASLTSNRLLSTVFW